MGLLLNYENSSTQDEYFSHRVKTHDGNEHSVRLMVKIGSTDTLIDPLDFRYQNGTFFPLPLASLHSALGVY